MYGASRSSRIGDRCTLGKGIGIVGHERIEIGDDIWTGHFVYITDQNHGYEDIDLPIGVQMWKNEPVSIGDGSWLGHGAIVLPGSRIGRHVVIAAGAVVAGLHVPDNCVVAGVPARIVRKHVAGEGWVTVPRDAFAERSAGCVRRARPGSGSVFGWSNARDVGVAVEGDRVGLLEQRHRRRRPLVRQVAHAPVHQPVHAGADVAGLVGTDRGRVPPLDAGVVEAGRIVAGPEAVVAVGGDRLDRRCVRRRDRCRRVEPVA